MAEVASTLNEDLLLDHMLEQTKDKDTRLFLLGSRLDGLRTTLFRQTLFAEFELAHPRAGREGRAAHRREAHRSSTSAACCRTTTATRQGVCKVDDLYGIEWAYIPHFYYNFYVYQYATSIVASSSLADGILAEAEAKKGTARARRLPDACSSSGSSKYPIDLLKDAGVDMTTLGARSPRRWREMNAVMDEMEKLLK